MKLSGKSTAIILCFAACATAAIGGAAGGSQDEVKSAVESVVLPLMQEYHIPGMAVGMIAGGTRYVFNFGVASTETGKAVTNETLFEVGSISKTLTATLAAYAQVNGNLSLSDPVSKYMPSLKGSPFGNVTLLELGTHTPGGLPLQVPDNIQSNDQLMEYFKNWRPAYPPGTYRTYNNPGIGMLGLITAKSMGESFETLMETRLLRGLGMHNSYINVPESRMADYAQGYKADGTPIRVAPGVLGSEAYGIKTTATDLVRFLEVCMNMIALPDKRLQRAISDTRIGYFKAGPMTQDLIWEQYSYPMELKTLLDGNSAAVSNDGAPVHAIVPPEKPRDDVWVNKTGTTNGFGAYVAFVPGKRMGIVILANKNYPIEARVTAAYKILTALANDQQRKE